MHMLGVVLLATATATSGIGFSKPDVGGKRALRSHVVSEGPPPPGGMVNMGGPGGADAGQAGRRFPNVRSQVSFLDPVAMKISWQTSGGPNGEKVYAPGLTVPGRYNFLQGFIYRLKVTDIKERSGVTLYPTIEVAPSTPATDAYLTHNAIPIQFTSEDFDQVVDGGNFVTKVIYLPDPKYQELAIAGVETLVSTRLEPGVDPILEADKRGTILMIIRLGGINLEMANPGEPSVISGPTVESVPVDAAPPTVISAPNATPVPVYVVPANPVPAVRGVPVMPAPRLLVPATPAPVVPPAVPPAPGAALESAVPAVGEAPSLVPTTPGL